MKKWVGLFLTMVLSVSCLVGSMLNVQAQEKPKLEYIDPVQKAALQLQRDFPDAEIMVSNGMVHVVLDEETSKKLTSSNNGISTYATIAYSSIGGSYRNFSVPVYETYFPYSQVYMDSNAVTAALLKMVQPNFYAWVIDKSWNGVSNAQITALALKEWGIAVPVGVINVMASMLYWYCSNWDYVALNVAQSRSNQGKAYVVHGNTNEGVYYAFYAAWNGTSCPTYLGYNASWYAGVYDFG